jgi:predicted phage-related endonuclease
MSVWDPGDFTIFRSRPNGFLTATADRLWMPEPADSYHRRGLTLSGLKKMWRACIGPVEFKTVSPFAVDSSPPFADWTEDEPSTYALLQVQHTLMVMEKPEAMLYALVGFDKLWSYHIHANKDLQMRLLDAERRFWNHVETGTQPIVSESEASAAALAALFPQDDGTEIELDEEEAWRWFLRLESARTSAKAYKEEVEMAQVPIKDAMAVATYGLIGDKGQFIWKTNKRGARPLRLKRKEKA